MPHLSIISPVYKAELIVDILIDQILKYTEPITKDFEIILVEDGSFDNSWEKIKLNSQKDSRIKGLQLSRNFGQHNAITAALDACSGEWVIVMDCDLQDRPEEIPNLYSVAIQGFDIVYAKRVYRKDSYVKKKTSKLFYMFFSYLSGIKQDSSIANFGIYNRRVINSVKSMREPMRAFGPMVKWVGFNSTSIDVSHGERFSGESTYNWNKLINLALDIAIAYSDKPLKLTVKIGLLISIISIGFALSNIILYLNGTITQPGYASTIVSIWFLSGLIIFSLGIVGLYLNKIFETVKDRPLYIIKESTNI
jgi:polyisoprenyl-phosphate glycosyltransferase